MRTFSTLAARDFAIITILLCAMTLPCEVLGQGRQVPNRGDAIQLGVDLVALNVTVVDNSGNFIVGLGKNNFEVYEDKVKQQISNFSREDAALNVGIIFDLSGSMKNKIRNSHDALQSFTRISRDDDSMFVLGFNNKLTLLRDFTTDDAEVLSSVLGAQTGGMTALYDAVYMGMEKAKQGRNVRRVLLVISDGQDNHSRFTLRDIERLAKESDIEIYSIGIMQFYETLSALDLDGAEALSRMAEITGGKAFFPHTQEELDAVCNYIGLELRSQYSLGFISSNAIRDGKWRNVKVKVNAPKSFAYLSVRSRSGYFAPQ